MSLLANAKISIQLGLEDYKSKDKRRVISALRNFHAGVLLLLKEKLRRLSPPKSNEVLIMQKMSPKLDSGGKIFFVGDGKKTVDIPQIKDRFKSLGIKFDWDRFDKMIQTRHETEHYHTVAGHDVIRGMVSDTFILVHDFVTDELKENPLKLFGKNTWKTLLNTRGVYQKERLDCMAELDKVNWDSNAFRDAILGLACPKCGSSLLAPRNTPQHRSEVLLKCRSCGKTHDFNSFATKALENNPAFIECHSCERNGYVVAEGKCVLCGEQTDCECSECGGEFPQDELNENGMCADCQRDYRP